MLNLLYVHRMCAIHLHVHVNLPSEHEAWKVVLDCRNKDEPGHTCRSGQQVDIQKFTDQQIAMRTLGMVLTLACSLTDSVDVCISIYTLHELSKIEQTRTR